MDKQIILPQVADSGAVRGLVTALRGRFAFLDALPIGRSVLSRDIMGMIVGNGRQKVLMAAAFHGQEWLTSLVLLRLCEDICRALESGGMMCGIKVQEAMIGRSLIMVPQVNPDGVNIAIHGSGSAGMMAKTVRELGGNTPKLWQANANGVDINHNFAAGWDVLHEMEISSGIDSPAPRQWGGYSAESEPETAAMVKLCERGNFRHVIALHSQGEEIYWQYGARTPEQSRIMADVMAASSGYVVANPEGLASHGGFKDWFIEKYGRPGFTIELGRGENPLPTEVFEETYQKAKEMLLMSVFM